MQSGAAPRNFETGIDLSYVLSLFYTGKVCCIFQHVVLGTFMIVSRVLPSYPPTYHTREAIPTDS